MTTSPRPKRPIVLCLSGHDPSGGAGLQADIETLHSNGLHACTIATALTVQNTQGVRSFRPADPSYFREQAECLLNDIRPDAVKIGMIGSAEMATVIADILQSLSNVPVVIDPVLGGNAGGSLSQENLLDVLRQQLLPRCTLLTPNTIELERVSGRQNTIDAMKELSLMGARQVLVTGGHLPGDEIVNSLWIEGSLVQEYRQQRLPGEFHGSGCTLASSCAAGLARGLSIAEAVEAGLRYTAHSISAAISVGKGQFLPWR